MDVKEGEGNAVKGLERVQRFLISAALGLCTLVLGILAVSHLLETSYLHAGRTPESVTMLRDSLPLNLLLTAAMVAVLLVLYRACERKRSGAVMLCTGLAAAAAAAFLVGARTTQIYDFQYVLEAAQLFAKGNYKPLGVDYFHIYSYQLGFCLPLEVLLRLFPSLDINRFMQAVNALLNLGSAAVMAALCAELTGKRRMGRMTLVMSLLFLPLFLFPVFVYGTVPMVFFSLCALFCFARYLRTRKTMYGLLWPVLMAAAYLLKPNAAVPMIAMVICAVLDVMRSRDWKILLFAALSAVLSVTVLRLVILQYELRGGMKLTEDLSYLARLVMGLKDGGGAAGWYNSYTDKFLPLDVTAQMERDMALADLKEVLAAFAAEPGSLFVFLREKLLSQWLEPTNGCLWYGNLNGQHGPLAGLAAPVYTQGSGLRAALEGYMNVFQQALYALSCAGVLHLLRRKADAGNLALPLILLGGVLYHLIFEAKSQYSYMYVLLLTPLAVQGLAALSDAIAAAILKHRG